MPHPYPLRPGSPHLSLCRASGVSGPWAVGTLSVGQFSGGSTSAALLETGVRPATSSRTSPAAPSEARPASLTTRGWGLYPVQLPLLSGHTTGPAGLWTAAQTLPTHPTRARNLCCLHNVLRASTVRSFPPFRAPDRVSPMAHPPPLVCPPPACPPPASRVSPTVLHVAFGWGAGRHVLQALQWPFAGRPRSPVLPPSSPLLHPPFQGVLTEPSPPGLPWGSPA